MKLSPLVKMWGHIVSILIVSLATFFLLVRECSAFYSTINVPASYENIGSPQDLVMLSDTELWYVDSLNYRIVKINTDGEILRTVGRQGSAEGEFAYPMTSIARDSNGYLYVLTHERVYKLDFNGGYVDSWGIGGNGGGAEFSNPKAIHYDAGDDTLLISDTGNNRIARFNPDGAFVEDFGTAGTGNGEFAAPQGLTTDSAGNIYVVDVDNHRVQVFEGDGTFIRTFGGTTPGDYYFEFPKDVEVLSNGDIVVTSQNSNLIKKFDATGVYITEWASNYAQYLTQASDDSVWVSGFNQKKLEHFSATGDLLGEIKNSGTTPGTFLYPSTFDFDASGNIYNIDGTSRIQKFSPSGEYLATLIEDSPEIGDSAYNVEVDTTSGWIIVSSERAVSVFNSAGVFVSNLGAGGTWADDGSATGEFNHARDMAIDSNGYLYVVDLLNARIQKFNLSHVTDPDFLTTYSGGFVAAWPVTQNTLNIFIDSDDTIYVSPRTADADVLTVVKYNTTGDLLGTYLDHWGGDPDQYVTIGSLYIDETDGDKLYLTDSELDRIQVYDSSGVWLETIGGSGSGPNQFDNPTQTVIQPTTSNLIVSDEGNHRLQIFTDGVRIKNLIPSADVIEPGTDQSLVTSTISPSADLDGELYFGNYIVSDFMVDLSEDRDWESVNMVVLPEESKSLVVNLNPTDAPGISSTHSLYVVKEPGQNAVHVCPNAVVIADVVPECTGGYDLSTGDPSLSSVAVDGTDYWRIAGLTGTGALGFTADDPSPSPTPTPSPNNSSGGGSNSSGSSSSNPGCSSSAVDGIPDLFQINTHGTQAILYFTPLSNTNTYYVSFATTPLAEAFGAEATLAREGVQNYTVSFLKPNTLYYFKVRGQNGCQTGQWSTIISAKTSAKGAVKPSIYYKYGKVKVVSSKIMSAGKSPKVSVPEVEVVTQPPSTPMPTAVPTPSPAKKKCFLWWCF